jgi:carbohydrate-binding DOMON domain-containing protein
MLTLQSSWLSKITAVHCDGRLNGLENQTAILEHDVIHTMTPSPIGNLPIKEALDIRKDKTLCINYEYYSMATKALRKHLK